MNLIPINNLLKSVIGPDAAAKQSLSTATGAPAPVSNQQIVNGGNAYQANTMTINNNQVIKNTSVIAQVVNKIADADIQYTPLPQSALPAGIQEKIMHNNVIQCRYIIESIKINEGLLSSIYDVLDQERPGRRNKIYYTISESYHKHLAENLQGKSPSIENIREIADAIINDVVQDLHVKVISSENLDACNEDVELSVKLIVADAFAQCQILENPKSSTVYNDS